MIAAFACWPPTALMVQETLVVALYPTSGWTWTWQLPTVFRVAESVIVKLIVDAARAPTFPPRFFSEAATTHGEPQPEVSTDRTV